MLVRLHGKHVAIEVPAAMTLDEIWKLINTSEKTRKHCICLLYTSCVKLICSYNKIRFPSACTAYVLAFTIDTDDRISKVVKVEK